MHWATHYIEKLQRGDTVQFRPRGNSMVPKIKSGQLVTVSPIKLEEVKQGDVVLCKVKGKIYLHQVWSIRDGVPGAEVLIGNMRKFANGWTKTVYGKVVKVEN